MPIRFRCQSCQARIKVPDGTEGKKVKCPRCGGTQRVPELAAGEEANLNDTAELMRMDVPVAKPKARPAEATPAADDPLAALASAATPSDEVVNPSIGERASSPSTAEPDPVQQVAPAPPEEEDPLSALAAMAGEPQAEPASGDSLFDAPAVQEPSLADEPEPSLDEREASAVGAATADLEARLAQETVPDHDDAGDTPPADEPPADEPVDPLAALASAAATESAHHPEPEPEPEPPAPQQQRYEPPAERGDPLTAAVAASVAKPRPRPQPLPGPRVTPKASPAPPRKIPLSNAAPSPSRPQPRPQPVAARSAPSADLSPTVPSPVMPEPSAAPEAQVARSAGRTKRDAPPPAMFTLAVLAWVLRGMAFFMVGGAVKLYLVTQQHGWDMLAGLAVLLTGLCIAGVTWAAGEIAAAVRGLARKS
jgi:predicted Zn finger-like uncharacterized protein